jgi:hypothetical protein
MGSIYLLGVSIFSKALDKEDFTNLLIEVKAVDYVLSILILMESTIF